MYCENDSVRVESRAGAYGEEFQLVVANMNSINRMIESGAIRGSDLNAAGEFVLPLRSVHLYYAMVSSLPRDEGSIIYSLSLANESKRLILTAAYTTEPAERSTRVGSPYIKPFTGIEFYGCNY